MDNATALSEINEILSGPVRESKFSGLMIREVTETESFRLIELAKELDEAREALGHNQTQRLFSKN